MKLTEEYVINKASKVLKDIGFWSERTKLSSVKPFEGDVLIQYSIPEPIWLVSFEYGDEASTNRPNIHITIDDATGHVHPALSKKHSPILTGYDEAEDKYYEMTREEYFKAHGIEEQ